MNEKLWKIVDEWRKNGALILDEEVEKIHSFCLRKMEITQIVNQEQYLPLLYADEIKNYLFRTDVNVISVLRRMEELTNV